MTALRVGNPRLPQLRWTVWARRSMDELLRFLKSSELSDPEERRREIEWAVESLRDAPLRCAVVGMREGRSYRRLVVDRRFFVYYIYTAPRGRKSGGTIWVRAVKHGASDEPFLSVRESLRHAEPLGVLSTHDTMEPATA
jgi:plasmid stabilization system protein ParE